MTVISILTVFTSNDIVSEESPKKEVNDPLDEKLNLNNYIGV